MKWILSFALNLVCVMLAVIALIYVKMAWFKYLSAVFLLLNGFIRIMHPTWDRDEQENYRDESIDWGRRMKFYRRLIVTKWSSMGIFLSTYLIALLFQK